MSARFRDRFVNNLVLACVSRPQYSYSCSVTALTAVINFLFSSRIGIHTQEAIGRSLGMNSAEVGYGRAPGNQDIMQWFRTFARDKGLSVSCEIGFDRCSVEDWATNEQTLDRFKRAVRSENQILVYHLDNHFNLVCGYFESARQPAASFGDDPFLERWVVLAEHDPDKGPVYSVRWRDIREDFLRDKKHCFMLFEKT